MSAQTASSADSAALKDTLLNLYSTILDAVIPILPPRPPSSAPATSLQASQYAVARSIVTRLAAPLEDSDAVRHAPTAASPPKATPAPSLGASTVGLASILPDILRLCSARAAPVRDEEIQKLLRQAMDIDREALNNMGSNDISLQSRLVARLDTLARAIQHLSEEMMTDIRTHHRKRSDASTASHATSNRPVSPFDAGGGNAAEAGANASPNNVSQESLILTAPPGTAADQFRRHVQSDLELSMQRGEVYAVWGGEEQVQANWKDWVASTASAGEIDTSSTLETMRWRAGLLDAIYSDHPVRLPILPTRANLEAKSKEKEGESSTTASSSLKQTENTLPYALVAGATTLFQLQNKVQAVVVLACLVAVVTSAVGSRAIPQRTANHANNSVAQGDSSSLPDDPDLWVSRLWMLLEDFIAEPDHPAPVPDSLTEPASSSSPATRPAPAEAERSRLKNLTAECIRAYRELRGLSTQTARSDDTAADEVKIEAGVRGALRYEDPVFKILRKRLHAAMLCLLLESGPASIGSKATSTPGGTTGTAASPAASPNPSSPVPLPPSPRGGAPARLATGRSHPTRQTASVNATSASTLRLPPVPGFTRPGFVAEKANEVVREVDAVCTAIVKVWGKDLSLE
ncbi:unnamed protein product [Tilletia controversa]|uniref:Uncharacterized protein n=3 Tax=Tilletia TaxID=13289 RepID=A0A8X7MST7_9BASI|nr:hypothetical protein CF336_g4346 [Tilletia laevis]KAE8196841.1 hypothetical protein CF328_g4020 [Tilletia controversa]KAE8260617.1 hypothetical protein A4X03_0g3744 [Tilletia caries]KAE8201834.1 hypothetical protein CF335_g3655 [Tilletia laevis]KAE8247390.1 hypothetical protein A4X06_0g4492 [Tilletia controversa]